MVQKMTSIVDVRLLTSNDGQIAAEDEVAVGNYFINTMWKNSKVRICIIILLRIRTHES